MKMINTAKEGMQDQLRKNVAVREEERDLAAEDVESIPSDHSSDSESSGTSSKPALSSSKESTLTAKHADDNDFGLLELKQAPAHSPLLALNCLWRKEMGHHTLND